MHATCRVVISSKWMNKWVKYVTNDGYEWESEMRLPDSPGLIDNAPLFVSKCSLDECHLWIFDN